MLLSEAKLYKRPAMGEGIHGKSDAPVEIAVDGLKPAPICSDL
jgi:hypothetical protein